MPDCFVQQNSGPTWAEHHFHRAGRRILCAKLKNCLASTLTRESFRREVLRKNIQRPPSTSALVTGLAFSVFFGNAHYIDSNQGLDVPRCFTFRRYNQNMLGFVDVTRLHLLDSCIVRAGGLVGFFKKGDLLCNLEFSGKSRNGIEVSTLTERRWNLYGSTGGSRIRNKCRCSCGFDDVLAG